MSGPIWLIAEREFKTYVVTSSFWVALLIGPLLMVVALAVVVGGTLPVQISVSAGNAALQRELARAVVDAGQLEGHPVRIVSSKAHDFASLAGSDHRGMTLRFSQGYPLSPSGRAFVATAMERDLARADAGAHLKPASIAVVAEKRVQDSGAASRFTVVLILWLTLTGSLGMLLQAVARERTNRSLELLLASASPSQIMTGKLFGVGAVSLLVLGAWLGSDGAASIFVPKSGGDIPNLFAVFADWGVFVRAAVLYLASFVFYGAITFGVGAAARDVTAAQNLARPMFAILLVAFFTSMASAEGLNLSWLVYVPPFTPFMILVSDPNTLTIAEETLGLFTFMLASGAAIRFAERRLQLSAGVRA